ncbi:hypothetical protein I302_103057 [Kwoniella bestiolae CBS 10118]|uniref:Uncharacterized protein n=1 Tax=Kwoniella bestiolae CBS 10118 TaxID=1296100 RepID=A0A1B9GGT8_9TREE|nr:hypothetical protein I302_01755 [Kwoniella bestiolae CBS 10118]OCF30236.1 hypothetical protein I302_01755 [Kwoniella bestiolae CBS 10118]
MDGLSSSTKERMAVELTGEALRTVTRNATMINALRSWVPYYQRKIDQLTQSDSTSSASLDRHQELSDLAASQQVNSWCLCRTLATACEGKESDADDEIAEQASKAYLANLVTFAQRIHPEQANESIPTLEGVRKDRVDEVLNKLRSEEESDRCERVAKKIEKCLEILSNGILHKDELYIVNTTT